MGPPAKPSGDSRGFGGESRSSGMSELSPLGESEREGELARRAKRDRPGAYGACDDEGRGLLDAPPVRADEDIGPYGWQRTGIFVGAAPCGRPRAHNVRPYGWCVPVGRGLLDAPPGPSPWGEGVTAGGRDG